MHKRIKLVHACLLLIGVCTLGAAVVLGWGLASSTAWQTPPPPRPVATIAASPKSVSLPPIPPQVPTTATPTDAAQVKTDAGLPSNESLGKFLRGESDSSVP